MTDAPWERISELLEQALERRPDTRDDFLDGACDGDAELRSELDSLLEAHGASGPLDELTSSLMGPLIAGLEPPPNLEGRPPATTR